MFVKGMDGTVGMGHKKARRACAVRAFRTSSVDSGDRRWRILGWRPCNPLFNYLIVIYINDLYFTLRCNKGIKKVLWLKINHILNVMTSGEELNS